MNPSTLKICCTSALLLALILAGCEEPKRTNAESPASPSVHLQGLDRADTTVSAFHGRVLVLNVWATWCPPCRREMPSLQRLHNKLNPAEALVVGLSVEADSHRVREWLRQTRITFPNYLDSGAPNARKQYHITSYPHTLFIAPDGRLIASVKGAQDWDDPKWVALIADAKT